MPIRLSEITAIEASCGSSIQRGFISWITRSARYHVWADFDTLVVERRTLLTTPTLYKNPLPGAPDWPTRRLVATTSNNMAAIRHVLAVVVRDGLIAKARAEHLAEQSKRERQAAQDRHEHQLREHAPQLAAALKALCDALPVDPSDLPYAGADAALFSARVLLAELATI